MQKLITGLLSAAVFATLSHTAAAANAANGKKLAERWCASCHVVEAGQKNGTTAAPPFVEVAKTPNFSAASIALFLFTPHPRMPDMNLSRYEAADLAAYIESLK